MPETPEHRDILIGLVAGLSLADHMGDVYQDCLQALELAGINVPSILDSPLQNPTHWEHLRHYLAHEHNAKSIWGADLRGDDA